MDWQPADPAAHTPVAEAKAHLADLGFPQGVLEDLRPEDIAACEGALAVTVKTEDHPTATSSGRNLPQRSSASPALG